MTKAQAKPKHTQSVPSDASSELIGHGRGLSHALEKLNISINSANDIISYLETDLAPISCVIPPRENTSQPTALSLLSPLASQLLAEVDRIDRINERLRHILSQLDL